jgi:hypothetical protein
MNFYVIGMIHFRLLLRFQKADKCSSWGFKIHLSLTWIFVSVWVFWEADARCLRDCLGEVPLKNNRERARIGKESL